MPTFSITEVLTVSRKFEIMATVSKDSVKYVLDGHLRNLERQFLKKAFSLSELDVRLIEEQVFLNSQLYKNSCIKTVYIVDPNNNP